MDVRKNEIYAIFLRHFACAIKFRKLDVAGGLLELVPCWVGADLAVAEALNKGSGPAAARTEVNKGVGLKAGPED